MTQEINGSYHLIARIYEILDGLSEFQYHRYMRQRWIVPLRDEKILELGIGTGKNLLYYHNSNTIQGIDTSPQMLREAKKKIDNNFNLDVNLSLQKGLPWNLKENDFTVGIATFVFCTMKDPSLILEELLKRIVKGGKLILFEYVRPKKNPLYAIMNAINPLTKKLYGVDFNRRPSISYLKGKITSIKITPVFPDLIEVVEIVK